MLPEGYPSVWLASALISGVYLVTFAIGEMLRQAGVSVGTTRRLVHVLSSLPALSLPALFASPEPVLLLGAGFAALMLGSRRLGLLGSIHAAGPRSVGAVLYPPAIALAFTLAAGSPSYYVAVLALGWGDPAAAFVGRRWGRHRYACWGHLRTIEGTIAVAAMTLVTTAAVLVPGSQILPAMTTALLVAGAVALAEAATPGGYDNLAVPLAALAMFWLSPVPSAAVALLVALGLLCVAGSAARPLPLRQ